jgi:hypothetical protein
MNCPYCKKNIFLNYKSVQGHLSSCYKNTGEYFIDANEGSIHYTDLSIPYREIKIKFPNLNATMHDIKKSFKRRNIILTINYQNYTKEEIINFIKLFVEKEGRVPTAKDWKNNHNYPSTSYIANIFGSWNNAIEAAGFTVNTGSLGVRTKAKDGILYRSLSETYFVNIFLYEKETYEYETKYPEPHSKYYDFYLPKRNLYIEIDGGLRPHVIQEKIEINKKLGRNLLVIPTKDIVKFKGFNLLNT